MGTLAELLQKATKKNPGRAPADAAVPDDVRQLYTLADGASFSGEVELWPWSEVEAQTTRGLGTLKPGEVWLLGSKRGKSVFFAARSKPLLRALPSAARANWLRAVP